ncbi:hypothetical protein CROQUDRAFT_71419 [Cronartium quercuum f. sp. fusiforme G11]|uniref:Uncharacterized protein n=1 Tax=Cronartium quercuum f. sp. fusiforme G11 TaxID=708437 RepID=A0A9P6TGE3_9BASI|nr:hypothetical protein CROQUDRAFT_71419 [Cronartium quercuum f. sp. fusiforme G11]
MIVSRTRKRSEMVQLSPVAALLPHPPCRLHPSLVLLPWSAENSADGRENQWPQIFQLESRHSDLRTQRCPSSCNPYTVSPSQHSLLKSRFLHLVRSFPRYAP